MSEPANGSHIGIVGAGSWGTALAILFSANGNPTTLWGNNTEDIHTMQQQGCNQRYLPEIRLPEGLRPTTELDDLAGCEIIMLAVPSHAFHQVLRELRQQLPGIRRLAWATKGFEGENNRLLHQVAEELFGDQVDYAVLSGPTFALEVAQGLPTAVTVASRSHDFAVRLATLLHSPNFRAYTSADVIGVEIGGAVKNVLAIAAGISDGLGFGANARAALITRGLAEIIRLGTRMGAEKETFMGLAGLGDLVLTCTDDLSRNRRFGLAIAQNTSHSSAQAEIGQVVEGIRTARAVYQLSKELNVEMPITEQVYEILYRDKNPKTAVRSLFLRNLKDETA